MKRMSKLTLGLVMGMFLLSACADHQFSPVAEVDGSQVQEPMEPEEPPPVIVEPEDPPPAPVGPSIVWVEVPVQVMSTHDPVPVSYKIIEGSSPVVKITCLVDAKPISCGLKGDTLSLVSTVSGEHKLQITVVDKNNLSDNDQIKWNLYDKFEKVKTNLAVDNEKAPVDVLFVVDNSNSMREEQANMAERISSFMDRVKGLDWRIAIVTTDVVDTVKGDGRFLKFSKEHAYLTSSMSDSTARTLFGKTIQTGVDGNFEEQGIRATYRAIERAVKGKESTDQYNKAFFREKSALAVIVISDENESGIGAKNKPAELVNLVKSSWGEDKMFKFHSIIARPGDTACSGKLDQSAGKAYADLSALTDGLIGNVCAADYGTQLSLIGQDVLNTQTTYELDCLPADTNADGFPDVKVSSSNSVPSFSVQGKKLIFSKPPVKGSYAVEYFCPKQ